MLLVKDNAYSSLYYSGAASPEMTVDELRAAPHHGLPRGAFTVRAPDGSVIEVPSQSLLARDPSLGSTIEHGERVERRERALQRCVLSTAESPR